MSALAAQVLALLVLRCASVGAECRSGTQPAVCTCCCSLPCCAPRPPISMICSPVFRARLMIALRTDAVLRRFWLPSPPLHPAPAPFSSSIMHHMPTSSFRAPVSLRQLYHPNPFAVSSTDADCSFNGGGTAIPGNHMYCICDAAWTGDRCQTLNLQPAKPTAVSVPQDAQGPPDPALDSAFCHTGWLTVPPPTHSPAHRPRARTG